mmetsp:Transcript_1411/g.3893  ORF Transcript_1411/g.3893 Transcript_1411/m.3893 type:complete len:165 (-) Transcript_1411:129-623(-)
MGCDTIPDRRNELTSSPPSRSAAPPASANAGGAAAAPRQRKAAEAAAARMSRRPTDDSASLGSALSENAECGRVLVAGAGWKASAEKDRKRARIDARNIFKLEYSFTSSWIVLTETAEFLGRKFARRSRHAKAAAVEMGSQRPLQQRSNLSTTSVTGGGVGWSW